MGPAFHVQKFENFVIFAPMCRSIAKAYITIAIRLRYDDATTHSTTTEVIEITIRLRYDYDPTTTYGAHLLSFDAIRREQKINMSIFRRSRVIVVS